MTAPTDALFDRSTPARIGVTLLNILLPGLGLIRLGHGREGSLIGAGALVAIWLLAGVALIAPVGSFAMQGLTLILFWLIYILSLLFSIIRTWAKSRRDHGREWWSRWYAIVLWWIVGIISSVGSSGLLHMSYKPFYVAADSMLPTFVKNEKIVADMRWHTPQVGNIVLVRDAENVIRIYRVAAIGGQTFAMRNGVPILNGKTAIQQSAGEMPAPQNWLDKATGNVLRERFPGESGFHRILQIGLGAPRDVAATRIPVGSVYLLGDDRDLAADSRVSPGDGGVGIMPASAIVGRPLYMTWSKNRSRIGQRADH
jgi:signal peptidase I